MGGTVGSYVPASVSTAGMLMPADQRSRAVFMVGIGASLGQVIGVPGGADEGFLSESPGAPVRHRPARVEYVELSGRAGFNETFLQAVVFPDLGAIS